MDKCRKVIVEWIPIDEKVPDSGNYLITAEHGNHRFVETAEYNNTFDEWYYHGSEDCDVIAWMPIIKPYTEDSYGQCYY